MILNAYASPAEHRTAIAISSFIVYICKREREREREREKQRRKGKEREGEEINKSTKHLFCQIYYAFELQVHETL